MARSPLIPVLCLGAAVAFVGASVALKPSPRPAAVSTTTAPPVSAPPTSQPPPPTDPPAEESLHLDVLETRVGTVVTGPGGATVYRSDDDSNRPPRSTCTGECVGTFPPVTVSARGRVTVSGINPALVGAINRADGSTQITLAGFPLYTYAGDENEGDTRGEGVNDVWHAIAPNGKPATRGGSTAYGN
jgi:predicted lipoprotein with Yx(FWY)xxD motif